MPNEQHVPDPDLLLGGEDPLITKPVREAIHLFESLVRTENEFAESKLPLEHMRDSILARVLKMLVDGGHTQEEIVEVIQRASQSLKAHRRKQTRTFRREPH